MLFVDSTVNLVLVRWKDIILQKKSSFPLCPSTIKLHVTKTAGLDPGKQEPYVLVLLNKYCDPFQKSVISMLYNGSLETANPGSTLKEL